MPSRNGNPVLGRFPYKKDYQHPVGVHQLTLDLQDDLGFSWGSQADDLRVPSFAIYAEVVQLDGDGGVIAEEGAWAFGEMEFEGSQWGWTLTYLLAHPRRGQFIDSPVHGLGFDGPTQQGSTGPDLEGESGGFLFFPGETIEFSIGAVPLGSAGGAKKVSPLDLFAGAGVDDPRVLGVARTLQTLDEDSGADSRDGKIVLLPEVVSCFEGVVGSAAVDWGDSFQIDQLLAQAVAACNGAGGAELAVVSEAEAQGNLEAGLNASGIFRKNLSKTEDLGEAKQKLDVMPVYLPGLRSNGDPSLCIDVNQDGIYDEGEDTLGVPYEEWRLNGDPLAEECDPRVIDDGTCVLTLIECREVNKPIVVTYKAVVDIYDDQVTTDFWPGRFSTDIFTAISRDDGTTWKRINVSRMADKSSFDLGTGEPFPGTSGSPYLKVNDNYILNVWQSKFCKSGNPRYSINVCPDEDGDGIPDDCLICRGNPDEGTEVCEPDYPGDDPYYVTDIWGVRGQQQSVDYDEVDDVADLGIGEIPYSCLWAARGVIVTQRELDEGVFDSLVVEDDPTTDEDESKPVEVGDIIWYKPERLTSGRRDAYIPAAASARGAGFAIAWQEDPTGLRPGKGKGPGQGWSGAISNHKTDIWYSYLSYEDFAAVDVGFVPGGPGDDPNGGANHDERPGLGRPKALGAVHAAGSDLRQRHGQQPHPQGGVEPGLCRAARRDRGGLFPGGRSGHGELHSLRLRRDRAGVLRPIRTRIPRPAAIPTTTRAIRIVRISRASTATFPAPSATPTSPGRSTTIKTACRTTSTTKTAGGRSTSATSRARTASWSLCREPLVLTSVGTPLPTPPAPRSWCAWPRTADCWTATSRRRGPTCRCSPTLGPTAPGALGCSWATRSPREWATRWPRRLTTTRTTRSTTSSTRTGGRRSRSSRISART